jgi:hypothetical protein
MPSINKLMNYNLATSVDNGGVGGGAIVSQNLWYWGDESSINTGSGYWEDKGIGGNDAVLNGTTSSFTNSGSLGVAFNGTDNWLNWNTSTFADIEDGYTIQFTFSPSWALSTINGYADSLKTFSLWNSETNNATNIGTPQMSINDLCPNGAPICGCGTTSTNTILMADYNVSSTAVNRNTYVYAPTGSTNINLAFVFTAVSASSGGGATGGLVTTYLNGVAGSTFSPMNYDNKFLIANFGKPTFTAIDSSQVPTSCGGPTNPPLNYFYGAVRDMLIYQRPLTGNEVLKNYYGVNAIADLNNL